MKKKAALMTGLITVMILAGCENSSKKNEDLSQAVTIAEEEVFDLKATEATDRDITAACFGGHILRGGMMVSGPHLFFGKSFPDCATVTISGDEFPKEIVIDYGEECTGAFGMERTGTITLEMTDTILNPGAVYIVTFENVAFGGKQVGKTVMVTNEGENEEGNWEISFQSFSSTTFENRGEIITITRDYKGRKEWISGFETPEAEDDRFLESGGGTMLVNEQLEFERNISDPLLVDRSCRYPLSGVIQIIKDGETMVIDFGEGECDNIAAVIKDGKSEEIDLENGSFSNGFQRNNRRLDQPMNWW
jgi:hypothetical protein